MHNIDLKTGITEISGEAGSGKTQIALSLCVTCAATKNNNDYAKALFVSLGEGTTQSMVAHRLDQMVKGRHMLHAQSPGILTRIRTRFVRNQEEFADLIFHQLPNLLTKEHDIGLIVMDSIASMFRMPDHNIHDVTFAAKRSQTLFKLSAQLKRLSQTHHIPIVIINQVTASFSSQGQTSTDSLIPALGLSWANCVNESFIVKRSSNNSPDRTITTNFSPTRPHLQLHFIIDASGTRTR